MRPQILPSQRPRAGALSGKTVTATSARLYDTMALTSDRKVFARGCNGSGQLGDGTTTDRLLCYTKSDKASLLKLQRVKNRRWVNA
jgi:alpha-tubulin suppressor-like RCC1 family protein